MRERGHHASAEACPLSLFPECVQRLRSEVQRGSPPHVPAGASVDGPNRANAPPGKGLFGKIVRVTGRLLNFLSPASAAGDHGGGGNSKTASRPEFGTCDGTSSGCLVRKN